MHLLEKLLRLLNTLSRSLEIHITCFFFMLIVLCAFVCSSQVPQAIHYYLRQHVFPACMNFQRLKISACGHELGSDILFDKRIGFSGTPSNLLPLDLGQCQYEPGSDGRILHVLTSRKVTSVNFQSAWTARSILREIATSPRPFHALIDTGALITGMDNEQVARFLLRHLPQDKFEGVVFLDRQDRQMIVLRSVKTPMNLMQCGIDPERRFTFYDQVRVCARQREEESASVLVVCVCVCVCVRVCV